MSTKSKRHAVLERDNMICIYCGIKCTNENVTIEHIIPRFMGGTDDLSNLAVACANCNAKMASRGLSDYLRQTIMHNTSFYESYQESIRNIEKLAKVNLRDKASLDSLYRMLFASTITAMETYLSDAFINTVILEPTLIRKLMETTPVFNEKKYRLSEILTWLDDTKKSVTQYLTEIIYHNVFVVKNMYKDVLGVKFPEDMEAIQKAIMLRHDIIHRNGKTKDGQKSNIEKEDILNNIKVINSFIEHIENQVSKLARSTRPRVVTPSRTK